MYNSEITVRSLIDSLENEVDIAVQIPEDLYVNWINRVEQLLYSDIIREQAVVCTSLDGNAGVTEDSHPVFDTNIKTVDLTGLEVPQGCDGIRISDIYTIYGYDNEPEYRSNQFIKTEASSGAIFKNTWYENLGKIDLNTEYKNIKIVYTVRPKVKTVADITIDCIMLPVEFVDLVRCKLRGEMYKVANEDALASKWLNDYNIMVEDFSAWIQNRNSSFGM